MRVKLARGSPSPTTVASSTADVLTFWLWQTADKRFTRINEQPTASERLQPRISVADVKIPDGPATLEIERNPELGRSR